MLTFPKIDPVLIHLGPLEIRWYGLAYLTGIGLGFKLFSKRLHAIGYSKDDMFNMMTSVMLGILLGGRLGYILFYNLPFYLENPVKLFALWEGGMSYHGGAIGAMVAFIWTAYSTGKPLLKSLDLLGIGSTIGIFFGRLSNFINGELYGRPTSVPWGIIFPDGGNLPRHPSQLYEAGLEGLFLGIVLWVLMTKFTLKPGQLFGCYLVGYSIIRFCLEFVREPDPQLGLLLFSLSMGQILSLAMFCLGVIFLKIHSRISE